MADHHLPYMWAAYRRGIFGDFEVGLVQDDFVMQISQNLMTLHATGGRFLVLIGQTDRGMIPVGAATLVPFHGRIWAQVIWFPEASSRNRMELSCRLYQDENNIALLCKPEFVQFYRHLCQYGVLRPVGKFRGLFDGEDAMIFETV